MKSIKVDPDKKLEFLKCTNKSDLQKVVDHNEGAFVFAGDQDWNLEVLEKRKKQGWEVYAVAREGEIIAAAFTKAEKESLLTESTLIKMQYQGQGHSHDIKHFFEELAQGKKASKLVSFSEPSDFRLIALNESHGYHKVEEATGPVPEGTVKWEKQIK